MDPFSGIAVLGARYGVKKIAQAFLGEGAEAELADGLVGLFAAAEQSQARLAEIEQRLDILVEQRYRVASGLGLRYLQQAMLSDRPDENRRADLRQAESHLVEASEASVTPLQRALCERMLVVVRFARRDRSGAADSQLRFDLALGEAAHQAWTLLGSVNLHRHSYQRWLRSMKGEEPTTRQALKELAERARGVDRARNVVWDNANAELTAVGDLFADASVFATMLDLPSPTRPPNARPSWADEIVVPLEVDAVVGEPVAIGGVTCEIEQVVTRGHHTFSVRVHLNARRREAILASWHTSDYGGGGPQEVRPGATTQLVAYNPDHSPDDDWPDQVSVDVSGVAFVAGQR